MPKQRTDSISRVLASFASSLEYDDLPLELRESLKDHVLDVIGGAIAATRFDFAARAMEGIALLAGSAECSVIGMAQRLPLKDAALINGVLAHGLDYDDTHPAGPVHPSSSVFPCVLGIGERNDCSGADLLLAYALGIEIATRLGLAANGSMHKTGFHTTGVLGHGACALAAGKLLGLDADRLVMAQGLAGSTAAAIAEHRADGAWNKRMHPGWAAVGGMTAASLAAGGFIGTQLVYEGVDGLFRTHAGAHRDDVNLSALVADLGSRWVAAEVAIKPYPVCHILHASIDSAIALRNRHALAPEHIAGVEVRLHPDTFHYVCENQELRRKPPTDYVAKFSAFYTVSAALVRGKLGFAELEPDALNDPRILALAAKTVHVPDQQSAFPEYFSGGVAVRLADGRTLTHHERVNRGAGARALSRDETLRKFHDNAAYGLAGEHADRIVDTVLNLEKHTARDLAQALCAWTRH
ncbi:MAG: MmgE/PrpD family protein [Burkholderiales bacterium]|nr:MmgE/PrpD family protein [Burkholderiales bacterium]